MKKRLRKKLIQKRDMIPHDLKSRKEAAIEKRLFNLDVFKESTSILMYVSFRSEVNTSRFLCDVLKLKKNLVLPVVNSDEKSLELYSVQNVCELSPGYMGILEPDIRDGRRVYLNQIDLVIIPGTGFDLNGSRLGYGGGYYDRLLSLESKQLSKVDKHIMTIALAFEEQIGDHIPAEPHDINVDMIITDERLIQCPS